MNARTIKELNLAINTVSKLSRQDPIANRASAAKLLLVDIRAEVMKKTNRKALASSLEAGSKLGRIKEVRGLLGCGLREGKEFVEMHFLAGGAGDLIV